MELLQKIRRLPLKPGVYLFKDFKGNIIYIGKAKKLKNRVSSYFSGKPADPKTARLVSRIADFDFIVVDNEVEALILEANLVREHRPHYNVNLKDDKRFPYIHVTDEPFPRIEVERRKSPDGMYFGPFTDARGMRRTLAIIQKFFRLRCCKYRLPEHAPLRACLNFDIGRCDAPCQGNITREEYLSRVEEVVLFLKGKQKELVKRLDERMKAYAVAEEFEAAAEIRDQVSAIESIWRTQKIDTDLADRDLHALALGPRSGVAVTMQVRQGRVISRGEFTLSVSEGTNKDEAMSAYLKQYYTDNPNPPKEVLVSVLPLDLEDIEVFVSNSRGSKVSVNMPSRGTKHELILLVERNAELLLADIMAVKRKVQLPFAIIDLQKNLHLKKPPRRIEAIDISHLGGTLAVASLVSFTDGKKYSRGYRRFRIESPGGDDYAAIQEVVRRRFKRLKEEGGGYPDLLLIDGGKGQLNSALKAIQELDIEGEVELASIAKRLEEVFRPQFEDAIMMPKVSAGLRLIVKIRDEAHRFAIEYQRKRRTKAYQAQELASIEGIGAIRQKKLLTEFASLEQIAETDPCEVAEKAKLPIDLARKVVEFLSSYRTSVFIAMIGLSLFSGCTPSPRYLGGVKPSVAPVKKQERVIKKAPTVVDTVITAKEIEIPPASGKFNPDALMGTVNLYLGTPYKYGGNSLSGIDCSGFVQIVMRSAGIDVPRTSTAQYRQGKPIARPEAGDLVFFKMKASSVDHVGVYLGDRRFAHASSSSGVTVDSLDDDYYKKRYLGARRFR